MKFMILSVFLVGCLDRSGAPLDVEDDAGSMRRMMAGVGDAGVSDSGKGDAGADVSPDAVIVSVDGPVVLPDASIVSPDVRVVDATPDRTPDADLRRPIGAACASADQCQSRSCGPCPGVCNSTAFAGRYCPTFGSTATACSYCSNDVARGCTFAEGCPGGGRCQAADCVPAGASVTCCR